MKRKTFAILLTGLILLLLFSPLSVLATEQSSPIPEENHTLLGRCLEYFQEHKSDLLGVLGDGTLFALGILVAWRQRKKACDAAASLTGIAASTQSVAASQSGIVTAANGLIDAYNRMQKEYSERQVSEDDRNKAVGALVLQTSAMLKILATVYVNNKNLPQGTKDLVNLEYAKLLAALEDDELLRSIVATARNDVLGASSATDETEEQA